MRWAGMAQGGDMFGLRCVCFVLACLESLHVSTQPLTPRSSILISKKINAALNGQVGKEFAASLQYVDIASLQLTELAALFYRQASESATTRCVS